MREILHLLFVFVVVSAILSFFPGLNIVDRLRGGG